MDAKKDTSHLHVRMVRKEKKMSLKELSERSGLSISFLSNYENGKVNISVASLKKISLALGVPISRLLSDGAGDVTLIRRTERFTLPHHKTKYGMAESDYLTRGNETAMTITVNRLPPYSETGDFLSHPGEEFIYVFRGVATVVVDETKYLLYEGDMLYYRSERLHKVVNEQDMELEYLQTNTPPTF